MWDKSFEVVSETFIIIKEKSKTANIDKPNKVIVQRILCDDVSVVPRIAL